jgi:hypothetical protein
MKRRWMRVACTVGWCVAAALGAQAGWAGETVVSAGAFKLRNGVAVAVNQALAPDAQLAPAPANP